MRELHHALSELEDDAFELFVWPVGFQFAASFASAAWKRGRCRPRSDVDTNIVLPPVDLHREVLRVRAVDAEDLGGVGVVEGDRGRALLL